MATEQHLPDYVDEAPRRGGVGFDIPVIIISRYITWVAIATWFGGQIVSAFLVEPSANFSMQYLPTWHHYDWQQRAAGYIFSGVAYRTDMASGVCAIIVLMTTMIETLSSSRNRVLGYTSVAAVIGAGVCLYVCLGVLWHAYGSSGAGYAAASHAYSKIVVVEIALLAICICTLTAMQSRGIDRND